MSYSAIKIPVPGNLIDTPGAENGHMLRFNNGVYENFRPLVVDMSPDSANRTLIFNVSVGTEDDRGRGTPYGSMTEPGMVLYKKTTKQGTNDFTVSINKSSNVGTYTLDVGGEIAIGSAEATAQYAPYIFPDGATPPLRNTENKFLHLRTDRKIGFFTLEDLVTVDDTINVSGNDISVKVDGLATNLYRAGNGIEISGLSGPGEDGISGGVIKADLGWLRADNTPEFDGHTGGLFHTTGGITLTDGILSINGEALKSGNAIKAGDGIEVSVDGGSLVVSAEPVWLSSRKNVFSTELGGGISIDHDGTSKYKVLNSAFGTTLSPRDGQRMVTFASVGSIQPTHGTFSGSGEFYYLGGHDATGSGNKRNYVMSFSSEKYGSDEGGLQIISSDNNNDEFAIFCENAKDSINAIWANDCGHDVTQIPLTKHHHPTFYVKATSGIVYNSSHQYTEGRILIGHEQAWKNVDHGAGLKNATAPRVGGGDLPNIPAHISIVSTSPSILLDQAPTGGANFTDNSVDPMIIMTSHNSTNMDAWGVANGTRNAATKISNKDGQIISIETTTTHMDYVYLTGSTSVEEDRLSSQWTSAAANAWSLDYLTGTGSDGVIYMRMGSGGTTGSDGSGTNYLPLGAGTPPTNMKVGGFWIDTEDNNTVKVKLS